MRFAPVRSGSRTTGSERMILQVRRLTAWFDPYVTQEGVSATTLESLDLPEIERSKGKVACPESRNVLKPSRCMSGKTRTA
jgi:hypothetical protein